MIELRTSCVAPQEMEPQQALIITSVATAVVSVLGAIRYSRCTRLTCCCCEIERRLVDAVSREAEIAEAQAP